MWRVTEKSHLHKTQVELEIPFHDVDLQRVVWHGHYYKYFEMARTKLLRSLDLDAGEIVGERYQLMVSESSCRHIHSLGYGDRIEVAAWIHDFENRLCIDFEIRNLSSGRRCARGRTVLVSLDLEGRLLLKTPRAIRDQIRV
jgi:acyl-CoA thioester hydrolase